MEGSVNLKTDQTSSKKKNQTWCNEPHDSHRITKHTCTTTPMLNLDVKPRSKKVHFSPVIHVHIMQTWAFARQACRRGVWEEIARDRERFQRRIRKTEEVIGHCFTLQHRQQIRQRLDGLGSGRPFALKRIPYHRKV